MVFEWPHNPVGSITAVAPILADHYVFFNYSAHEDNLYVLVPEAEISLTFHMIHDHIKETAKFTWAFYKRANGKEDGAWERIDTGIRESDCDETIPVTVTDTLEHEIEFYLIQLRAEVDWAPPSSKEDDSKWRDIYFIACRNYVGNFILDYLPISIVYCPPGQDMSASLTKSISYGTKMTVGKTDSVAYSGSSKESANVGVKFIGWGSIGGGEATGSDSQDISNVSSSFEVGYFRETTVTADNKTAIGRVYWGPLGDLYVIGKKQPIDFTTRVDVGKIVYSFDNMEKLLIVPVHKLLRPGDDEEIKAIPRKVRRELLKLNPFINLGILDLILPENESIPEDETYDLKWAVDATLDPSRGNRAELIGFWFPKAGSDLQYRIGKTITLKTGSSSQVNYSSSISNFGSLGTGLGFGDFASLGFSEDSSGTKTVSIGLQSSRETDSTKSTNASCHIVRNQNADDSIGIGIYYDKIFSTLMFRKLNVSPFFGIVEGTVSDKLGIFESKIPVELILQKLPTTRYEDFLVVFPDVNPKWKENFPEIDPVMYSTITTMSGKYAFRGLFPGDYTLKVAGKVEKTFSIPFRSNPADLIPEEMNLEFKIEGVERIIELETSPVWEVQQGLRLDSYQVKSLQANIENIFDWHDLALALDLGEKALADKLERINLSLPRTPLFRLPNIEPEQIAKLHDQGIDSIQDLWTRVEVEDQLTEIAENTDINQNLISKWINGVDSKRVSNRKDFVIVRPKQPSFLSKQMRSLSQLIDRLLRMLPVVVILILLGIIIGIVIGTMVN